MPKPKKTPKAQTPKSRTRTPAVPVRLMALAALVQEGRRPSEVAAALTAARTALRESAGDYPDAIHAFIEHSAKTSYAKDDIAKAERFSDDIDLHGGIHNAFASPALLCGLAVAYVMLTNDGGER